MSTDHDPRTPPPGDGLDFSSLGDDGGRPFSLEPEDRLAQFKTRRAKRRVALGGIGVVTACALAFGVAGLGRGGTSVEVVPAGQTRVIDPRDVLFTAADLPDRGEPRLREQEDTYRDESEECITPFVSQPNVFTRMFTVPDTVFEGGATGTSEPTVEAPHAGDFVWGAVAEDTSETLAVANYRSLLAQMSSCIEESVAPDPTADNVESGLGTQRRAMTQVSGAPGSDEAQSWRQTWEECATRTLCFPVEFDVSIARVGLVVIVTTTGFFQSPGAPAASDLGQQMFHRAVQRANQAPTIDLTDLPTPPARLPTPSLAATN